MKECALDSSTKKNVKFVWSDECQSSFEKLKQALNVAPVLAMPTGQGDYVLYTDASKLGLGSVLMQSDRLPPVKANVVAHSLSWKTAVVGHLAIQKPLQKESTDEQLQKWKTRDESKGSTLYLVEDDIVKYRGRLWVPSGDSLRVEIMTEMKADHQRPAGWMRPVSISECKWENITMYFMVGLPKTMKGYTTILVIVDFLTKSAHLLPLKTTYSMSQYFGLYI
ncbi:uncharacterized protein LOC142534260 [Primulina tabacum]|uniref:uncharacterized protein LOC142534260 n=1 Tax=Primulina tabacum TaxID=48773 RepID=UPI003F5A01A7